MPGKRHQDSGIHSATKKIAASQPGLLSNTLVEQIDNLIQRGYPPVGLEDLLYFTPRTLFSVLVDLHPYLISVFNHEEIVEQCKTQAGRNRLFALQRSFTLLTLLGYLEPQRKALLISESKIYALPQNFEAVHQALTQQGFRCEDIVRINEIHKDKPRHRDEVFRLLVQHGGTLQSTGASRIELCELAQHPIYAVMYLEKLAEYTHESFFRCHLGLSVVIRIIKKTNGLQKLEAIAAHSAEKSSPFSRSELITFALSCTLDTLNLILSQAQLFKNLYYNAEQIIGITHTDTQLRLTLLQLFGVLFRTHNIGYETVINLLNHPSYCKKLLALINPDTPGQVNLSAFLQICQFASIAPAMPLSSRELTSTPLLTATHSTVSLSEATHSAADTSGNDVNEEKSEEEVDEHHSPHFLSPTEVPSSPPPFSSLLSTHGFFEQMTNDTPAPEANVVEPTPGEEEENLAEIDSQDIPIVGNDETNTSENEDENIDLGSSVPILGT
ncbi:MAG: hypothetical protein HY939_04365 [Gammaproteobacteria bacterium]|nr:hypothetical protein [Gammaproteobacteria bacterium]